ncbi:MAG TPA: molybdopterin-synthase adenylyltransferase MoeB [Thermoplasmata archaeon]|nr:molybdopterin-synthase adenylyltransferase MoeB [Thermoplasmata archaeon]
MAAVQVQLPTTLRSLVGGVRSVEAQGSTISEVLRDLVAQHAKLAPHLYGPDGRRRTNVAVYVNDEDTRYRERDETPVTEGDVVELIPAIAGGAASTTAPPPVAPAPLSKQQLHRYSRHLLLPEVGVVGQKRLLDAKVLLVGAGGLGAPAALYLTAAGVGTIGLVDFDRVEVSNLQRQILYGSKDVGHPKLAAAKDRLSDLNPDVTVVAHEERLTRENAFDTLRPYDVVVDGTDNFATRYLVNDACVLLGKPTVYGSIYRFEGQATVFDAARGPCYRCLYPEPPPPELVPSCAEAGVLGVLPGIIGTIQAIETVKRLLDRGDSLVGRLLLFDALAMRFREVKLRKNPDCVLCGTHPTQTELIDYPAFCGVRADAHPLDGGIPQISVEQLSARLRAGEHPLLLDVREPEEWDIAHLPDATLIPLDDLPERVTELARATELVVYCKSGARSSGAARLLIDLGFNSVRHLAGGIDAWARRIDPEMPRY